MVQETLELLVEGGKAKPGPASAQKLAVYKINMGELFQKVNEMTKDYGGMNVPVKVLIEKDGSYSIKVGTPPVSSLIKKELGLKKIGSEKKEEVENDTKKKKKKIEKGKEGEKTEEVKEEKSVEKKEEVKPEEVKEGSEEKTEEKPEGEKPIEEVEEKKEREIVGNLTIDQCIKIARMKRDNLLAKTMKGAVKEVVASVVSMPLMIENKNPKKILKEIDKGKWDHLLK